jgi:hypothetical protein
MVESKRHIPERIARKLKDNYSQEIPQGSVLVTDFREDLESYYRKTKTEFASKSMTTRVIRSLIGFSFTKFVIKNPDSVKNRSIEIYFDPLSVEFISSLEYPVEYAYRKCFKNEEQLKKIQSILRRLSQFSR